MKVTKEEPATYEKLEQLAKEMLVEWLANPHSQAITLAPSATDIIALLYALRGFQGKKTS